MIYRAKLFIDRYLRARKLGFNFFGARFFKAPGAIKINDKLVNLSLPNEHGVKISFVDIFLDDVYKLELIKNIANKNNIKIKSIVDIGGNCGLFSIFSRIHFPISVIHCYEPNLFLNKYLKKNAFIGLFKYFNEAVGGYRRMVSLNIKSNNSVNSNVLKKKIGSTLQISFDTIYKRIKSNTIDIVKMDCEGSEWEILNKTKIWKNIKFLTMEYHLKKNKYNFNRVTKALDRIGFKLLTKLDKSKKSNYGVVLACNPIHIYKS
jgi:FkbM family methyltransferase